MHNCAVDENARDIWWQVANNLRNWCTARVRSKIIEIEKSNDENTIAVFPSDNTNTPTYTDNEVPITIRASTLL